MTGPENPIRPLRYRWLVAVGFVLAVAAMLLGFIIALAPLAIGIVLATSGRRRAGIAIVATTLALVLVPRLFFLVVLDGRAYRIPSAAMEPTLDIGDRVLTIGDDTPERGDLVVFNPPAGAFSIDERCGVPHPAQQACPEPTAQKQTGSTFVKRVVALPGERVRIAGNRAYVNGVVRDESGIRTNPCTDVCDLPREITIPEDHYFVLGDNRGESDDSRDWGPVPQDSLKGRVVFRYWPLGRLGGL